MKSFPEGPKILQTDRKLSNVYGNIPWCPETFQIDWKVFQMVQKKFKMSMYFLKYPNSFLEGLVSKKISASLETFQSVQKL